MDVDVNDDCLHCNDCGVQMNLSLFRYHSCFYPKEYAVELAKAGVPKLLYDPHQKRTRFEKLYG